MESQDIHIVRGLGKLQRKSHRGFGGILFCDAGYIWNDKLAGRKLHADIGAGMLRGLTKSYECKILYLNMAKSLDTNDRLDSFGSRMYFKIGDM